ncbi:TauD/TfdA family dioxygenase [Nocardia sp. NPDC051463]|uniref:TauD/TfdA family dioxygenase n=1 Tax=Nocardia sp. NPDC051463 TaxID=3154845 RepID=UPI003447EAD0
MDSIVDMQRLVESAQCGRGPSSSYRATLEHCGFAILESDDEQPLSLEQIMGPLGQPVSYQFGTKLTMQQRPGTANSQFRTGDIPMHVDAILNATDVSYIGMECIEAPYRGGETLVSSSAAFFAIAPTRLIEKLREIKIEYWSNVSEFYVDRGNPIESPIRVDPVTGRDTLYLGVAYPSDDTRNFGAAVVGWTEEQSLELFEELADLLSRPQVMYSHKWEVGHVLVLDNRRIVHGRAGYPADAQRKLMRISVA